MADVRIEKPVTQVADDLASRLEDRTIDDKPEDAQENASESSGVEYQQGIATKSTAQG